MIQTMEPQTRTLSFRPTFDVIDRIDVLPLGPVLRAEPMFYQSSIDFVRKNGGPIAQQFLDILPLEGNVLIDIRTHKLQAGYYPAIPGYHIDWVPRKNKGADPDMDNIGNVENVILIVGETSLTEYVNTPFTIQNIPDTKAFEYCNEYIKGYNPKTWHVPSGSVVHFTSQDWHRASPATGSEWRFFIRASKLDSRYKPANEIRTQSQVYIPMKEANW